MPKTSKPAPKPVEDLYSDIEVRICRGDSAIDMDTAMELLGWQTETKTIKFGEDFLFTDDDGFKIRCFNNTKNRPLNVDWCRTLAQDILNGKWKFNCETIIISKSGQVLSGQHRLIALILAIQMWRKDEHFKEQWPEQPVLESLVALGADEDDGSIQTLDNVRSRTLADTLYTSQLFKAWSDKDKRTVVSITDKAVGLLWKRTGMNRNKYSSKMTNSEAHEFLLRHLRLLDAVKHIYMEDLKGTIKKAINLGHASALMILQSACEDNRDTYTSVMPPDESNLEFARWDDAVKFWIQFSISDKFKLVKTLMMHVDDEDGRVCNDGRIGIIVKAWLAYVSGEPFTEESVGISYDVTANGDRMLAEFPTIGGIDVGHDGGPAEVDPDAPPF